MNNRAARRRGEGQKGPPRGKPWRAGQSGNPQGRPRLKPKTPVERAALRRVEQDTFEHVIQGVRLAQSFAPEVIRKFAELARSTDPEIALNAGTALLDRALWPKDASGTPQLLPAFAQGSIADRAQAILHAVSDGRITPAMGATLADLLNVATDASLSAEVMAKLHQLRQVLQQRGLGHLAPVLSPVPGK